MSLSSAAEHLGTRLRSCRHVRILAHDDADGIAAAAILCLALERAGIGFHVSLRDRIVPGTITAEEDLLLCDLGASYPELPEETMVVDHHTPHFTGAWHVNPRLEGDDGENGCSSAGAAYLVAQELGDNGDLAGLAITGMIGDRQSCTGVNRDICSEGMAAGTITPHRGLRLAGRDLSEQLLLAVDPCIERISGDEDGVRAFLAGCTGEEEELGCLVSRLVLEMADTAPADALLAIYGDRFELGRETVHDAHTFAAMLEACGKSGKGGLGLALALRSSPGKAEAWEITRQYRLSVINTVRSATLIAEMPAIYEIEGAHLTGAVADALAYSRVHTAPVVVLARDGEAYAVSARTPAGVGADCAALMEESARAAGGSGGGHAGRAGAYVPAGQMDLFRNSLLGAIRA
ncbi:MAG: DHH family phosphoesterase [Methanomicrobiales archaeon]|nr:DHH family phosphoesterase [Methanomicrobiales archaeon]